MSNKNGQPPIFFMGYEHYSVDSFFSRLKREGIECIIDVRQLAISRKNGFNKSGLDHQAQKLNIVYKHIQDLGAPKRLRDKLKKDHDYRAFFKEYYNHLRKQENAFDVLYKFTLDYRTCIFCYEHSISICHRKIIFQQISEKYPNREIVFLE